MRQVTYCWLTIVVAATSAAAQIRPPAEKSAAEKPAAKSRSLDQQLLDDLDRELLKGLPRSTKAPDSTTRPGEKEPAPSTAGENRPPSESPASDSQNPLANIA